MIGALWTGISGLSSHQKALDNESNNIANVNTVGFKSSRISFADQMYQSKIGKGSIVQDAEKMYVQGNTKITGVEYDMMLEGDGFFTVVNKNTLGTAESFYTRAGNFRMGDNGTLQDAGGNEVQGWIMAPIDTSTDVTSTNPNTSVFTNVYNKMLGSKIIRHGTYVETVTAKATDYNLSAKSDSTSVFSGDGAKSKSSKVADIENAIKDYNNWLQKLKEEPDATSANSLAQVSQLDFESGNKSVLGKDGDRIYVVIDGQTISTNFIVKNSTPQFREDLWNGLDAAERTAEGLKEPSLIVPGSATYAAEIAAYDKAAGKIETYKALADLISNRLPVEATMAIANNNSADFNEDTGFKISTYPQDMLKGIIQIKSLIPGQEFKITEVGEQSGTNTILGKFQTTAGATKGSGIAAVQTSKDALSRLISGKQQDVYTTGDLALSTDSVYEYSITIFDKELVKNVPVPSNNATPPAAKPLKILVTTGIDDVVDQINANSELSKYVEARNVNGNLVIQTKNDNYDVEFTGTLTKSPGIGVDFDPTATSFTYSVKDALGNTVPLNGNGPDSLTPPINYTVAPTTVGDLVYNLTNDANNGGKFIVTATGNLVEIKPVDVSNKVIDVNKNYSGREGAGAEFLEIVTKVDQTASKDSIQLRLDTLNISDSPFGEFSVDNTGLITMKQDGAEFAIGQVAIARFNNNRGLEPNGNNLYGKTTQSGDPIYNINNNKTADVRGKALELSNADLSESLVNLMIFQRAFEANAKSITTSDELLNTLINLKR